jgi:hypothetical protein
MMKKPIVLCLSLLAGCAHAIDESSDDAGSSIDAAAAPDAGRDAISVSAAPADVVPSQDVDAGIVDAATTPDVGTVDVVDAGPTDSGTVQQIVFVSSTLYDGNLGGLSGADSKCQSLATAASLKGAFKAWLSDSTSSASSRLTHATTPYVLVDSTVVAKNWTGLTSGTLLHAIDLTETGQTPSKGTYGCSSDPSVWSHTDTSGASLTNTGSCSDWQSTTATTTHAGSSLYTSWAWTNACQIGGTGVCAKTAALYCVQQ